MKRFISTILILSVLLSFAVPVNADDTDKKESFVTYNISNYTYNSSATNSQPESSVIQDHTMKVTEYPSATDKSVYWEAKSTKSSYINTAAATSDKIVVEFDIQYVKTGAGAFTLNAYSLGRSSTKLVYFDSNGNLRAGDGTLLKICGIKNEFSRVSVAVDCISGKVDIYFNGEKLATKITSAVSKFTDISELRLTHTGGSSSVPSALYMDNFKVYIADEPTAVMQEKGIDVRTSSTLSTNGMVSTDEELAEYMQDSYSFYENKNNWYFDGEKRQWTGNNVLCKVVDTEAMICSEFVNDVFGITAENSDYTKLSTVAETLGLKVTADENGMIVLGNRESWFNCAEDMPMYRTLAGKLVYDSVSSEKIKSMLEERYETNEHPRILANKDDFTRIKSLATTDEVLKKVVKSNISAAEEALKQDTIVLKISSGSALDTARSMLTHAKTLGFAYQLTGDERYAAKLWDHMEAVCNFADWDDTHTLSTGEYLFAMALAYDWIYDWMSDYQRSKVRDNIMNKGLNCVINDYQNLPRTRSFNWAQSQNCSNWKLVVNAGVFAASTVLMEDEPETCSYLAGQAMDNAIIGILGYAPDGAWFEGTTYWNYTTIYYMYFVDTMMSAYGDDFGYLDFPGIKQTVDYLVAIQGDNGTFAYGDSNHLSLWPQEIVALADRFNREDVQDFYLKKTNASGAEMTFALHYRPEYNNDTEVELDVSLDHYVRDTETVMMHSSYDKNSIFAAMHAGDTGATHGQFDTGQVVIDAYGTDFLVDHGQPSYTLRPVWYVYRRRTEAHNLFVINPDYYPGQNNGGFSRIDRFESNESSSLAITDLTAPYSRDAESAKRGLKLFDDREAIILQDEVVMKKKSDFTWVLHTGCDITVSEDGKSAVFEGKYKNMRVTLLNDVDGVFTTSSIKPLDTSPVISGDTTEKGNMLKLELKDVKDITVSVAFTFFTPGVENSVNYSYVPLDEWKLDDESTQSVKAPRLDDLCVNGNTITDFDSKNTMYAYMYTNDQDVPVITATGDCNVEITYPEEKSGFVLVKAISKANSEVFRTYTVKLIAKEMRKLNNGSDELFVYDVEASLIIDPTTPAESAIDGDLSTRYSGTGQPYLTFDLGSKKTLTDIAVAVWQGPKNDGRKQSFQVSVSDDGENFEVVYDGVTTGTTLEQEIFNMPTSSGRYVRVQGIAVNGILGGGYTSFTEISFFGR